MKRKTAKILYIVMLIGMAVLLGVGTTVMSVVFKRDTSAYIPYVMLFMPIFIWLSSKLRCPHCGSWPRRGRYFDNVCSQCGKDMGE